MKRWYEDLPEEFEGCSSDCGRPRKHTLRWGSCAQAVRPEPTLGFWRTFTASDGHESVGMAEIPLNALLPWTVHLTTDQRWEMLEEAASADDPARVIRRWKARAERRNPIQINIMPPREPEPGYGPGHLREAFERGRRQGRHEAGG